MKYDPIKEILGRVVRISPFLRKLFYKVLGLMFLREWHVKRALHAVVTNHPIRSMFDAGTGFGQYSYYCARQFPDVNIRAVDVKTQQIKDCSAFFSRVGISNVVFAVEDLTFPLHSNEFDLILSVDVMEHIPDDVAVFRNFYQALRNGGFLLVNTPSALGGSDVHSPGDKSFVEEHVRAGYDETEIRTKLESAGFLIEQFRFTYGRWGTVAWRLGIKIPMLLLNKSLALFFLLPLYYLITLPFTLLFMYLDYRSDNKTGTGLLVTARKA